MNPVLLNLATRQLLSRRRTLVMLLLALIPVPLALVFRIASEPGDSAQEFAAAVLLDGLVITGVLPLVTLVMGTAAIGSEIEDGTAVYILAKPIPRWQIVVAKLLPAWVVSASLALISVVASGGLVLWGEDGARILPGFAVAVILGSLVYTAVFIAVSIMTSRALIAGLAYVFLWEGVITGLFSGTRMLSIREYSRGIADAIATTTPREWEARLDGTVALVLMVAVTAIGIVLAINALRNFEIGETA